MTYIVSFVIVLGLLVLFHELGHYLAARLTGVRVEKFSIGFGPKIIGKTIGETEYMISSVPLGGYVKLAGEEEGEEIKNEPYELPSKTPAQRLLIFAAGSVMNLVLAFLLMPLVYLVGIEVPAFFDDKPVVGWVEEASPAEAAGLVPGDLIVSMGGRGMETWKDVITEITLNPGKELAMEIEKGGRKIGTKMLIQSSKSDGGGYAGIGYSNPPVVGGVKEGWPADEAGLREGDVIVSVTGTSVKYWHEMSGLIRKRPRVETSVVYSRSGATAAVSIVPRKDEKTGFGQIGISAKNDTILKRFGVIESITTGTREAWSMFGKTFVILGKLVSMQISLKSLGGPIMIAQQAGAAAKTGATSLIYMMAFLSLQLGIINLLPIPVLDGGHIFFLFIEMILGRPLSVRKREMAQKAGLFLLLTLMLAVTINDVMRIWDGLIKALKSIVALFM